MLSKLLIVIFILSAAVFVFAQDAPVVSPSPASINLDTILNEAARQSVRYRETFRDLLATEIKTFERFENDGDLKNRTKIESNFFVYQSSKYGKTSSELRNVVKVDDKPVPDSQARADRFLGELQKAKTVAKELEKIQDESLRYDKSFAIYGLTLFEAIALAENMRPYFDFNLLGTENYMGREVYVVAYRQMKKSPFITINEKKSDAAALRADFDVSLPGSLKKTDKILRGKLWIDAQTFQLAREEREIAVLTSVPLVAQKTVFEYEPSEFEIFVPKKIVFTEYAVKKGADKNTFSTVKNAQITFDYSKFKKTDVEIQILDDDGI
jgi:hypothetical protein